MVDWIELLFGAGEMVIDVAASWFERDRKGEADGGAHLPLPEVDYEERGSPPDRMNGTRP